MKRIIDIPDEIYDDIKQGYICSEYADTLIQLIPSSKPYEEQPQGEWVEVEKQGKTGDGRIFTYTIVVCSECGEQYDLEGEKFCPHCGADMRGE